MTSRPDREPERVDILVVDDRPAKLVAMEVLLADLGENVVCVDSGAAALRQLLARDFAVILLDVNMPEMDGFEVAALIRQRPRLLHIPIIFMTAAGDDTHALRGYSLGAVDYILTPVVPEVLRTKVKVFVDLYRMQEQLKRRAEERIVLAEEQGRRAAAEAASRRAAFLADAGTRMARSLDVETTAKAILALAVPDLADFAMLRIDVGGPEIVHARHRLGEHLSAELDARLAEATSRARRSGARELLVADEDSPGAVRGVVWPLLARGATIGVLGLVVEAVRATLDPVRLTLIGEFAARAAVALDNCLLYREIQERDARKEQFVAMLAHELRNPLGAITSAVGVLDIASGDPAERARAIVKRQLQHLTQLVDDLLDTTRISTGKIELARSSVNLAESVTRCLTTLQVVGSVDEYRIEVESEDTWVDADPARIDQIIANLVGNAVKYTPSGGRISIRVSTRDDCGILEVADTGVGMSPEVRARVFELFYQDDRSPDRRRGGLGIGLTLVRQLAELHGGSVEASSEGEGLGSRFTVRLPLGVPAPPPAAALPEADPKGPSRCRLLIIEDNDDARHMLEMLLSLAGHEVHAAGDGPDGIELARRIQPDVVLIDLGLPGMDGYEVARRLRKDMARTLRLVAISGYGQAEDRKRTLEAGFDMHLVKPVDPMHLSTALASLEVERPVAQ